MDKLELDDRVSRLERKLSLLTILMLGSLLLLSVSALFLLRSQSEVALIPATPAPMIMTETKAIPPVTPRPSEGSINRLAEQLLVLEDLQKKSVLSPIEFQTKKSQILAKPIRSFDLKADLEQIADLQTKNILSPLEFQSLKTKILEENK
jgi:hypothetical protein